MSGTRPRLIGTVDEGHRPSARVLEKNGMRPFRRDQGADGAWWLYAIDLTANGPSKT